MSASLARSIPSPPLALSDAGEIVADARPPLCFVVDSDTTVRRFVSLILHGAGVNTREFDSGEPLAEALAQCAPDVVFLDIALELSEAVRCLNELAAGRYRGQVQLVSNRGSAVLAHVKSIGKQRNLQMLPVLKKPIEPYALLEALRELKLGHAPASAGRIGLDEALDKGWLEYWYQPKIDLRKRQLVGVEAFARVRHPRHGIMMPDTFMLGAPEASLIRLAEHALTATLQAGLNLAKLGINLQLTVNVSAGALSKVRFAEILPTYRSQFERWPGLIVDLVEEQIVDDIQRFNDIAEALRQFEVSVAIENCGRRHAALSQLKSLPFAEVKIDRAFVADCAANKVNAPLCKTIIELAHNFGSAAVAIGIEKASDAAALLRMGCDYGQGFLLGQPMPEELLASLLRQRVVASPRTAVAAQAN